jgi:hypothetical protein
MYPMGLNEFRHWLSIFRTQFPADKRLESLGVSWYPGRSQRLHEEQLSQARTIGSGQDYRLFISNSGPDDERIRVGVQGRRQCPAEAYFWLDPEIELDQCYFGFDDNDLKAIHNLLSAKEAEIRAAWQRFSKYAKQTQAEWLAKLETTPAG